MCGRVRLPILSVLPRSFAQMALLSALVACAPFARLQMGPVDRMIPPLPDNCRAKALADLTGQNFVRLADETLVGPLSVLWPNQEVSGDLDSTRLNAQVTTTGRIKRLFCG